MAASVNDVDNAVVKKQVVLDCQNAGTSNETNADEKTNYRCAKLNEALDKYIDKIVGAASLKIFKKSFAKIHEKDSTILKHVNGQYQQQLEKALRGEIDVLFEEENIVRLLSELDRLGDSCNHDGGQKAWHPSGNPEEDIVAHLLPHKRKHKAFLEDLHEKLKSDNELYAGQVEKGRKQIRELADNVENETSCYQKILDLCEDDVNYQLREYVTKFGDS